MESPMKIRRIDMPGDSGISPESTMSPESSLAGLGPTGSEVSQLAANERFSDELTGEPPTSSSHHPSSSSSHHSAEESSSSSTDSEEKSESFDSNSESSEELVVTLDILKESLAELTKEQLEGLVAHIVGHDEDLLRRTSFLMQLPEMEPWQQCSQCDAPFQEHANAADACEFHSGALCMDKEATVWTDATEPVDSAENRILYPEGFRWECCSGDANSLGC
eukprot:855481_1